MCPHFIQTYSSLEQVLSALSLNLGQRGSGQRKEGEKKQKVSQPPQPSGASTLLTFTAQKNEVATTHSVPAEGGLDCVQCAQPLMQTKKLSWSSLLKVIWLDSDL